MKHAIVQSVFDFAMREINALETRIVTAEDDVDAMLWEQARQVVAQLEAGLSQRALAAQWINTRTGEPYSQMHVSRTARTFETFTFQPRQRFRDAYNAIANRPPVEDKDDVEDAVDEDDDVDIVDEDEDEDEDEDSEDSEGNKDEDERGNVHFSSASVEHYTPAVILEAAVACLGRIDLDPCSNNAEAPNVPARRHYTIADDGLSKVWRGVVYMNPPYGREIDQWIAKLCAEHEAGRVTEAIALLPARPDTQWFSKLRDHLCCFVTGRLTFVGNEAPAPFPSVVFYLGSHPAKFYKTFANLGDIWRRVTHGQA